MKSSRKKTVVIKPYDRPEFRKAKQKPVHELQLKANKNALSAEHEENLEKKLNALASALYYYDKALAKVIADVAYFPDGTEAKLCASMMLCLSKMMKLVSNIDQKATLANRIIQLNEDYLDLELDIARDSKWIKNPIILLDLYFGLFQAYRMKSMNSHMSKLIDQIEKLYPTVETALLSSSNSLQNTVSILQGHKDILDEINTVKTELANSMALVVSNTTPAKTPSNTNNNTQAPSKYSSAETIRLMKAWEEGQKAKRIQNVKEIEITVLSTTLHKK